MESSTKAADSVKLLAFIKKFLVKNNVLVILIDELYGFQSTKIEILLFY